ncbi:hypothetical protein AXF42_Ash014630 [Apostasia shenzhenica]|uniref:Uncharacterized protein n=1 Tax=Apostasia shenzhenica TaxID=1088818 RepID=A0A2I0AK79_9ASPA|nr:hypothetical protein AXF42_Ash014630 [Apostasia shenzhenica]
MTVTLVELAKLRGVLARLGWLALATALDEALVTEDQKYFFDDVDRRSRTWGITFELVLPVGGGEIPVSKAPSGGVGVRLRDLALLILGRSDLLLRLRLEGLCVLEMDPFFGAGPGLHHCLQHVIDERVIQLPRQNAVDEDHG